MAEFINLAGQRFGKLTALEPVRRKTGGKVRTHWKCSCDCGKTSYPQSRGLRNGTTRSCGCYTIIFNAERVRKPEGEAAFNRLYGRYKGNVRATGRAFNLTREEFKEITSRNCFYCGSPPRQKVHAMHTLNGQYLHNGIDRIDNSRGYEPDNVRPCCRTCNFAKNTMDEQEFIGWVQRAYNHLFAITAADRLMEVAP
jgi:hypothetical protein